MIRMFFTAFFVFFSVTAYSSGTQITSTMAAVSDAALTKGDFSVIGERKIISLGDPWNEQTDKVLGQAERDDFVGTVDYGDDTYKFYRHQYDGFDVYTSNLWWDKAERTVDDYIIAQITLTSSKLKTNRGAYVGMPLAQLRERYGAGKEVEINGSKVIHYLFAKKRISFEVVDGQVASIIMSYNEEDE
ncbi:hypothetical protein KXR87_23000 [Yokenella regensburgei]|uniref:hypothetical protein n=1 Tax=Yokenella regensburgei TaxID=158877 RepID=UPI003F18A0C8